MQTKKIVGGLLGVAVAIGIAMIPVEKPLTTNSMIALGCLAGAVVWLLTDFLPDYQATLAMCVAWVVTGAVPMQTAFSTFSSSTWWLLFGALSLGVAASESGLLKRIALYMMKLFPPTFKGQSLAMVISGIIVSPLIPSTTAKSAIIAPLARSISESIGFAPSSKGASGLFVAFYTGYVSAGMGFLSASFISYSLIGLMPKGQEIGWMDWFLYSLPWLVVAVGLMTIILLKMYEPKEKTELSKDYIQGEIEKLGPWTWQEKATLGVLLVALVLWMTERATGIPAAMVATGGAVVCIGLGIYNRQQFRSQIAWDSMIFIGTIICIAAVFSKLGIDEAVKLTLGDKLEPLMSNIWIFVPFLCVLIFVIRFIIVSWTAAAVLVSTLLIPLCPTYGIHPFIIIFCTYVSTNTWNVIYQNTPYITSLVATDNKLTTHKELLSFSFVYMACSTLGCIACIPVWKALGLC